MASQLRATPAPQASEAQALQGAVPAVLAAPAHAYLARLAALHDEAAETAHLANLLGRAPWAASILGVAALIMAVIAAHSALSASLGVWVVLMALAVGIIGRSYARAAEAPFDRATLKGFARDLSAVLVYAGAAWGAGLFLAVPGHLSLVGALAFTAVSALATGVLRTRHLAFCFLVPATAMGAFCGLMRDVNVPAALAIVAGGLFVSGAAFLVERLGAPVSPVRQS